MNQFKEKLHTSYNYSSLQGFFKEMKLNPTAQVVHEAYRICTFEEESVLGLLFTGRNLTEENFKQAWSEMLIVAVQLHYKKVITVGFEDCKNVPGACKWLMEVWLNRLQKTLVGRMKIALVSRGISGIADSAALLGFENYYGQAFNAFNTEKAAFHWLKNMSV